MGVHIIFDPEYYERLGGGAVLVDSVSGTAFGPLMHGWRKDGKGPLEFDAKQMAFGFLHSFQEDARTLNNGELDCRWTAFSQRTDLVACPGICDNTPIVPPATCCDSERCLDLMELLAKEAEAQP